MDKQNYEAISVKINEVQEDIKSTLQDPKIKVPNRDIEETTQVLAFFLFGFIDWH